MDDFDIVPDDIAAMGNVAVEAYLAYKRTQQQRLYQSYLPYAASQQTGTLMLLALGAVFLMGRE